MRNPYGRIRENAVAASTTVGGSDTHASDVTVRPRMIVIFDERGELYTKICQLDLGLALRRVSDRRRVEGASMSISACSPCTRTRGRTLDRR